MTTTPAKSVFILAMVLPGWAWAAAAEETDKKKLRATWEVTRAGTVVGQEQLKMVVKADGSRYMSFIKTPPGKKAKRPKGVYALNAVLWRDAAAQLTKYMRVEDRRLGQGIRVFRRGAQVKIVGINARKDMSALALTDQVILDRRVWGTLWDWLPRIRSSATTDLTVSFIDIGQRTSGKAIIRKGVAVDLTNRRGAAGRVTPWTVSGSGISGLTLYLDSARRLVGARSETHAMLLKGWSWEAPPAAPEPEPQAKPTTSGVPDAGPR